MKMLAKSRLLLIMVMTCVLPFQACTTETDTESPHMSQTIYDFSARMLDGTEKSLSDYRGNVVLIVNTASKCGFTPQYEGLQKLYDKYKDRHFVVLGFPCNQFGNQEPGSADDIQNFCQVNYGVTFPMFAKVDVNGEGAHPLYKFLKDAASGFAGTKSIKWNFTKFLIDPEGKVIKRFASKDAPDTIDPTIKELLDKHDL